MAIYDRIAGLPVRIEGYELERRSLDIGFDFPRVTTVIHLHGGGEEGVGEDVSYMPEDHERQAEAGPVLPLTGGWSIDELSRHLDGVDLWYGGEPTMEQFREYRRWAFESAALDLALRQARASLADVLDMPLAPLTFVVSTRLDGPEGAGRVVQMLGRQPSLRFKLDPTDDWPEELITQLAALGVVDVIDLKGQYGDDVPMSVPRAPETYRRVIEAFPHAFIEDPRLTPGLRETLTGHEDRVTWDAPIHSVDDILGRDWAPRTVNMKPSRFGPLSRLFAAYDHIREQGMGAYSGGQTELGPGRGQVQYLASLFHPHSCNDIAPAGYNDPSDPEGLPGTPLPVQASEIGFRWGE
ncbi:MAG TPA: hypothetical protein PKD59_10515 [Miltoncostaeaceae bacterium]|nr:hypothetical protein [Miltoncostaeaceae bacterium]